MAVLAADCAVDSSAGGVAAGAPQADRQPHGPGEAEQPPSRRVCTAAGKAQALYTRKHWGKTE